MDVFKDFTLFGILILQAGIGTALQNAEALKTISFILFSRLLYLIFKSAASLSL